MELPNDGLRKDRVPKNNQIRFETFRGRLTET